MSFCLRGAGVQGEELERILSVGYSDERDAWESCDSYLLREGGGGGAKSERSIFSLRWTRLWKISLMMLAIGSGGFSGVKLEIIMR